jgi:hypothetical protein
MVKRDQSGEKEWGTGIIKNVEETSMGFEE